MFFLLLLVDINTPYALDYFPDDFEQVFTYVSEDELERARSRKETGFRLPGADGVYKKRKLW